MRVSFLALTSILAAAPVLAQQLPIDQSFSTKLASQLGSLIMQVTALQAQKEGLEAQLSTMASKVAACESKESDKK